MGTDHVIEEDLDSPLHSDSPNFKHLACTNELGYHLAMNASLERISIDPAKRSGQPCIRDLRMTVQDILEYMASGMSRDEILKDFPELEPKDLTACLAFAAHREQHL